MLGAALFGAVGYLPTYLQLGLVLSPVASGFWMLTLAGGLAIGTLISAQVVGRTGVHRPFPVVGAVIAAAALGRLALLGPEPAARLPSVSVWPCSGWASAAPGRSW